MSTAMVSFAPPPKFSKRELLGLQKYDAMLLAIAACQEVDELVDIHDKMKALVLYAREAQNYESELRALDIRIRASRRAGELIAEGQKKGEIADVGRPTKMSSQTTFVSAPKNPKTLDELGISRDQSSQWKELAGVPEKEFEEELPVKTGKRTSAKQIIQKSRPKPDPEVARRQKLGSIALSVWGRVGDISDLAKGESLHDIVNAMDRQLVDGLKGSIPKVFKFLANLEREINSAKPKK